MALIDFILNLAALLLWLNWRSARINPLQRTTASSLVATLRPAQPRRFGGWQHLAAVIGILLLRAVLYWAIGSPQGWTARLDLGMVALPFRTYRVDEFLPFLLYSLLSFGKTLVLCYFWLLAIVLVNYPVAEPDPVLRLLRFHVGRVAGWPWYLQLALPLILVPLLWMALNPLLAHANVTAHARAWTTLLYQGLVLDIALVLSLKYVLPGFLFFHLILSYVFLGNSAFWEFVSTTASNLLRPLRWLPTRISKFDFAPVIGVALIFLLLHWLPAMIIQQLAAHGHSAWPE